MKFAKQLLLVAMSYVGSLQAQEHVHGAGSVFVIQEGNVWQVQYVLPAADALGFEHAPEDKQELARLASLVETLKHSENLMLFRDKGAVKNCKQTSYVNNLNEFATDFPKNKHGDSDEDAHHKHEGEGDHQENHDSHEGHDVEHEVHHQNIEASFTLQCVEDITGLSFLIFKKMPSLQTLEVQWSIELGQGSAVLSNDVTELKFN